jgi:formylglycine-generating enzyme required for sulfatase activity
MRNVLPSVLTIICVHATVLLSAAHPFFSYELFHTPADSFAPGVDLQSKSAIMAKFASTLNIEVSQKETPMIEAESFFDESPISDNMACVEGGTFVMGCFEGQGDCWETEKPAHVVLVKNFYISKYEVTQKQWRQIMGTSPSFFKNCDDCPVEQVTWNEIQEFIKKLNAKTGKNYRLPTEAEWEFAAREGGKNITYANGKNTANDSEMNFNVGAALKNQTTPSPAAVHEFRQRTAPVGKSTPNKLGIYDMSGNVWEWCSDNYSTYTTTEIEQSKEAESNTSKVMRGGSWKNAAPFCRTTSRNKEQPNKGNMLVGFRLAR